MGLDPEVPAPSAAARLRRSPARVGPARLKAEGLYERAAIVVTADNGESFGRIGNGHEVTSRNAGDIALTPLLIKAPFQHDGATLGRHVRTADVVPTVARLAGIRPGWRTQGRSAYGRAARRIPASAVVFQRSGRAFRFSPAGLRRWALGARRLKLRLFGSGDGQPGLHGIGPFRALVGRPTSDFPVDSAGRTRASVNGRRAFGAVRLSSAFVPAYVTGHLTRPGARPPGAVAVAVNGQVAATSPTYRVHRGGPLYFSALVPESALHEGRNDVLILSVSGSGRQPRLRVLGP